MSKILLSGDIQGNLDFLLEKIEILLKSSQFELIFSVGQILSINYDLTPFCSGQRKIPIPIYFLEAGELGYSLMDLFPEGKEICPNLYFLGRSGVRNINGLNVAWINGIESNFSELYEHNDDIFSGNYFTKKDIDKLIEEKQDKLIDIFLSNEWPMNFERGLLEYPKQVKNISRHIAALADNLCPRYHIVGLEGIFYQRKPYKNKQNLITRLIAMGKVPKNKHEASAHKYLFALQMTPAHQMEEKLLYAITPDTTENPFLFELKTEEKMNLIDFNKKIENLQNQGETEINKLDQNCKLFARGFDYRTKDDEIQDFLIRWGDLVSLEIPVDHQTKKNKGYAFCQFKNLSVTKQVLLDSNIYALSGKKISFTVAQTKNLNNPMQRDDCWFCLGNPKIDKSLIFFIEKEIYLSLDKGPVTERHIQILPIQHFGGSGMMTIDAFEELTKVKKNVARMFLEEYQQQVIFYERTVKIRSELSHMVMHCVPIRVADFDLFLNSFEELIKKRNLNFFPMKENEAIIDLVKQDELYIYIEPAEGDKKRRYLLCYKEKDSHAYNFDVARYLICEYFNWTNRNNWKDCLISEDYKTDFQRDLAKKYKMFV